MVTATRATELAASAELEKLLGASRQQVNNLTTRVGFPDPVAWLSCGRVWDVADVTAWAKRVGRKVHEANYRKMVEQSRTNYYVKLGAAAPARA